MSTSLGGLRGSLLGPRVPRWGGGAAAAACHSRCRCDIIHGLAGVIMIDKPSISLIAGGGILSRGRLPPISFLLVGTASAANDKPYAQREAAHLL